MWCQNKADPEMLQIQKGFVSLSDAMGDTGDQG